MVVTHCFSVGLLAIVLVSVQSASAQISGAVCQAGFDWSFNSRGQSPCSIAAYLDGACLANPTDAFIQPLNPDSHYVLTQSAASLCYCNTVFYSIISACATCQGDDSAPWATWRTNCTQSYPQDNFPVAIPAGTAVPAWAYMDIVALGTWNATDAQAFKAENDTEFTAPQTSTSSTLLSTSNTPSASSTVVVTPTSSTTSDNTTSVASPKKSHVGAIVGGVVGGVGGAVIAAIALVLWLRHRKNQRRPPSAAFRNVAPLITTPYTPEPNEKRFSPSITTAPYSVASAGLIYNPDDPTTFPDTQAVNSVYSQSMRGSAVFSAQNGYQPAGIRYTGVAEL